VAVHFGREGASGITISYLDEHKDAEETKAMVEKEGASCIIIPGVRAGDCNARTRGLQEPYGSAIAIARTSAILRTAM
jgi:hypothetical protein